MELKEREYIRALARRQKELATLPEMREREQEWYRHNEAKAGRPMVVVEYDTFLEDFLPPCKCVDPLAQQIERTLLCNILNYERIGDDKVVPDYYPVFWRIHYDFCSMGIQKQHAKDSEGRTIGYAQQHPIGDLEDDFHLLQPSTWSVEREATMRELEAVQECIGDILDVRLDNSSLRWMCTPSEKVVELMGLETMMYSLMDYPDKMHELYQFIVDDTKRFIDWQQQEGLLCPNNGNHYAGAGSYGFSRELNAEGRLTSKDMWGNMNSQETVCISADMYQEFVYPYYKQLSGLFGLVYYGCCEPVDPIWDNCVSKLDHLRKVSISPWCNQQAMGEKLRGSGVIYSRKPSPNYLGVDQNFDEEGFRAHIQETLDAAKGCTLEFIFRDVYTLVRDESRPGRAVNIVRELSEKF